MKNTVLIAVLALAATPAMASKARLSALNNAAHIEDIQDTLKNPAKVTLHGDWLTFEMGTNAYTTAAQNPPRAEGGFARGMGDARYGFYLGHHANWVTETRVDNTPIDMDGGANTYLTNENPVNLFYGAKAGDLAWGVGLDYSNSDKKSTKQKQSATGLNAGVTANDWEAYLNLGLMNTYENDLTAGSEVDFKGKTAIELGGEYRMDTMTFVALARMNGGKEEIGTTETVDRTINVYNLGVVNSHKAEGTDFFYGANYVMTLDKNTAAGTANDDKIETSALPVFAGIEADATSWMVLRASVRQNFILGSTKTTTGAADGEPNTVDQNTSVAAGAGLKFGKLLVDGTLEAANSNTAALNGNAFLANAAVTYMF
ncbi:MAG: hypothetical protein ACAH59_06915 [Pseudobdellovibrionaceae bacterium]